MRVWLRELRKKAQLTQSQLATRLQTAKPTVSQWELGTKDPGRDMTFLLADELGSEVLDHFAEEARAKKASGAVA